MSGVNADSDSDSDSDSGGSVRPIDGNSVRCLLALLVGGAGRAKVCGHELCSFPGCSEEKESETGAATSEHQVPVNNRYRSIDTVQTDDGRWARLAFFNIC